MREKIISCGLWVAGLIIFLTYHPVFIIDNRCFAQAVSSTDLINRAQEYDGKTVVYAGEVIGEVMPRGQYSWLNVSDGENAIGVWLEGSLAQNIYYTGSYKARGDTMELSGIFHRACPEHGGDLDIHARQILQKNAGREAVERLNTGKRNLSLVLLGGLALIWILSLFKKK